MRSWRPFAETVHLTVLGLWLGTLVMTGAAAAIIFPMMKKLDPRLPAYAEYTGAHWLIAAGQPAAKFFLVCDVVQFACSMLAIISLLVIIYLCRMSLRRPSAQIRLVGVLAALAVFGFYSIYFAPRLQLNMRGFWEAALAGNNTEAAKFQQVFDADHPTATRLMGTIAVAVFIALVSGIWSATTSGAPAPSLAPAAPTKPARYEEPELLRRPR